MHFLRIGNKWLRQNFNMVLTEQFKVAIFGAKFQFLNSSGEDRRVTKQTEAQEHVPYCLLCFILISILLSDFIITKMILCAEQID